MKKIGELVQEADWTKEKHVPVIDCEDTIKADELLKVTITIGKEIGHPNTTEHHISWISLYFQPEGEKFPCQIGRYEFNAHGASAQGPNTGSTHTHHSVTTWLKTSKSGTLFAVSMCNIHGLWESEKRVELG